MPLEKEYLEYSLTLIITVLGISSTYLVDFSKPITLTTLTFLPILYGHTAFISKEKFNKASLLSLFSLLFSVVGGFTAAMSIFYGIGNVLVSLFAGGDRLKDYYESVSIPLLISGLILGATIFGYASIDKQFKQNKVEDTTNQLSEKIQGTLNIENQKTNQLKLVNRTSHSTIKLTTEKVKNESKTSKQVIKVLEEAEKTLTNQVYKEASKQINNTETETQKTIKDNLSKAISSNFYLILPISAILLIALHPLVGLLTAVSAKAFSKLFS